MPVFMLHSSVEAYGKIHRIIPEKRNHLIGYQRTVCRDFVGNIVPLQRKPYVFHHLPDQRKIKQRFSPEKRNGGVISRGREECVDGRFCGFESHKASAAEVGITVTIFAPHVAFLRYHQLDAVYLFTLINIVPSHVA